MGTLLRYPLFAILQTSTVTLALVLYRALYVDAEATCGFLASLDPAHLRGFTLDDFPAPLLLAAGLSVWAGAWHYFGTFVPDKPPLGALLKFCLVQVTTVDYFLIGSSIAVLCIADALSAGWRDLHLMEEIGAVFCFWWLLAILAGKAGRFWAFLSGPEPERGSWILPIERARALRR